MAKIDHISYGGTNYEIVPAAGDLRDIVAPEFSDQSTYAAGSYVLKNGVLYRFTSDHTGAWTGSDAEEVTVGSELNRLEDSSGSGTGLTEDIKQALLTLAEKVAYIDEDGQDYYDTLHAALYPPANLTSISCVYTQSEAVYETTSLDDLKPDLVVTAHFSDSSTQTVSAYGLSGTLTVGTSTITVSYGGKTTTFNVIVSASPKSDMNGWTDGIAYTDLTIVEHEYVSGGNGTIVKTGTGTWNRTGYVPCHGASTILFPRTRGDNSSNTYLYDENYSPIQKVYLYNNKTNTVTVPDTAYYFIVSEDGTVLNNLIADGIVPYE